MLESLFATLFVAVLVWAVAKRSQLRLRVRLEVLFLAVAISVAAAYVVTKRFESGLGAVSNMSDQFPWGIWIAFDLCGVALAAGGFVMAGTVHVLHAKRFEPILRPALLTSFIAYQLVAAILVLDLGRPYRFWHPLIMWQPHSVMFEITFCLSLYTVVLALEFSPAVCERFGWHKLGEALHALALPAVILGVILSTLHQSSFGSLFLILPEKLHPIWYTPLLPVLFLVSAVAAGISMVIVESAVCARFLRMSLDPALLRSLGRICGRVLIVLAALKLLDLLVRQPWGQAPTPGWLAGLLVVELLLAVVPAAWLMWAADRERLRDLALPATAAMAGVVLNRLNVCWFALIPVMGPYVPNWKESVLTLAFVMLGGMAFVALCQFLPVFPRQAAPRPS